MSAISTAPTAATSTGAALGAQTDAQATAALVNPAGSLGKDDFLKLLAVQLQNQDPSSPMDNQAFMAQMAQFSALEQTTNMATELTSMDTSSQISQSVGLIGHTVGYTKSDGSAGSGTAESVTVDNGAITIKVGSDTISPGDVTMVGGTASDAGTSAGGTTP